ncbi:hypothetical protein TNCV_89411 [Trichonephila clavipes]|nr:hypothetical protein TNCV_89411 [Trichonephila clavipes]
MPDHRIFQRLHRQLRETCSFYVTRHGTDRRRAVASPSLEESISYVVADRPRVKYKSCCSSLQALRLSSKTASGSTVQYAAPGLHNSCAEQF